MDNWYRFSTDKKFALPMNWTDPRVKSSFCSCIQKTHFRLNSNKHKFQIYFIFLFKIIHLQFQTLCSNVVFTVLRFPPFDVALSTDISKEESPDNTNNQEV